MTTARQNDLGLLLPSVQRAVQIVLTRLHERGYDPLVWETYRTRERALELAKKGSGIALSMHELGAAADIVSKSRMWDWPSFYEALAEEAEKIGLTSGHRWKRVDSVHVQAVPVAHQSQFRKLKPEHRDAYVRVFLKLPYHDAEKREG